MEPLLAGKTALITGGASGIGRATVAAFAREGATVAVLDRDEAGAADAAAQAGGTSFALACDVTDRGSVAGAIQESVARLGGLDVAVNSAGIIGAPALTADLDEAVWDRILAVNLKGTWLCMRAQIPHLLARGGGSIVNVASTGGLSGAATQSAYNASKHGVIGLTRSASIEYGRAGIRVNAVCPGPTQTPLTEALFAQADADARAHYESMLRLGRFGEPHEIAEAIVWIAGPRAAFVLGVALPVDGGLLA